MSNLDFRSKELRRIIVNMMKASKRGHLASALSIVEIIRVLYDEILSYDPANPKWTDRDRFILSKGHGALALYPILSEKGFFPKDELWTYCLSDSILGGHPEIKAPGVEASTGSLGHGLSIGLGFAINAKFEKAKYRVFVLVGDGETNEGSIWEAALSASKHHLDNLTVIVDCNAQQSYSSTEEVLNLSPYKEKWKAFGFAAVEVDGHNIAELRNVFCSLPLEPGKPSVIICHTVKGKGINKIERDLSWHHKSKLNEEDINNLLGELK
jgi:transketolase